MSGEQCSPDGYAAWFDEVLELVSTREGLFNALGTLIHNLEEACSEGEAREVLASVLSREAVAGRVSWYVGSLARLREVLESDQRLRDIRVYKEVILEALYRGLSSYYGSLLGDPPRPLGVDGGEDIEALAEWFVERVGELRGKLSYPEALLTVLSLLALELERASGWDWGRVRELMEKLARHPKVRRLWRELGEEYARFYRLMHVGPYSITAHYRYAITQPIRESLPRRRRRAVWEEPTTEEVPVKGVREWSRRREHSVARRRTGGGRTAALALILTVLAGLLIYVAYGGPPWQGRAPIDFNVVEGLIDRLSSMIEGLTGGLQGQPPSGSTEVVSEGPTITRDEARLTHQTESGGEGIKIIEGPPIEGVVLSVVNSARERLGLPPLREADVNSTRYRVLDMASRGYYGHCDLEGLHPGAHYTRLGGVYAFEENLGIYYVSSGIGEEDAARLVEKLVKDMLYNDAESNWGHRDSLLDPTNTHLDAVAAVNGTHLYLVVNLEKRWVQWTNPPQWDEETGLIRMEGIVSNGTRLEFAAVYYAPFNTEAQYNPRLEVRETCGSYSLGELVAFILPPPPPDTEYISETPIYYALRWLQEGNRISLAANLTQIILNVSKPGQYTLTVYATRPPLPPHPYDPERYHEMVPLLEYTVTYRRN